MRPLLAALPPLVAAALLFRGVAPARAAVAALASGVALLAVFRPSLGRLASAEGTATLTAVEVVAIILGGVLLYEALAATHALDPVAEWIARASCDPGRRILFITLGVTPFAESVTGFGVGIVIGIPLLRRIGFRPTQAAIIGLLGLIIVPWGALAPGTLVAARLTGVSFDALGTRTALLSLPVFLVAGFTALLVGVGLGRALGKGLELLTIVATLWVAIWVVNATLGPPLAGALGTLVGAGAVLVWIRVREGRIARPGPEARGALQPYALLLAILLGTRLVVALAGFLGAPTDRRPWNGVAYVLTSPALALLATAAAARFLLGMDRPAWLESVQRGVVRWQPIAVTTIAFLLLGGLMNSAGMARDLANAAVSHLHHSYLLLAPWVGGLGGYVTGSNTGANAMLATAQARAADRLDYPLLTLIAVQNVSASLLTMACAPRIALAQSLVGGEVRPASIARVVLCADCVVLVVIGLVALVW